jgi:ribose transport system substrate-binding protein
MLRALTIIRSVIAAAIVLLLVAGGVAACGSSSSSSGGSGGTTVTNAAENSQLGAVEAQLQPWITPPRRIAVTQPLKKLPSGQLAVYLECSAAPCVLLNAGFQRASTDLGMRYVAISSGATPESFQAAAQEAVNQKPAVVLMPSVDPSLISKQLAEMKAAHILTVDWATSQPPAGTVDQFWLGPSEDRAVGASLADYAMARSNLNAHVLYVNQSVFTFGSPLGQGIQQALTTYCKRCSYAAIDSLPQDVGSKIPSEVVAKLQSDPSINWVIFAYGEMTLGVPQALRAASLNGVHILTQSPAKNNYADLKSGSEMAVSDLDDDLFAYYAMDSVARALVHQPVPDLRNLNVSYVITSKDVTFDPNTGVYHPIPDFQQQFHALWGTR